MLLSAPQLQNSSALETESPEGRWQSKASLLKLDEKPAWPWLPHVQPCRRKPAPNFPCWHSAPVPRLLPAPKYLAAVTGGPVPVLGQPLTRARGTALPEPAVQGGGCPASKCPVRADSGARLSLLLFVGPCFSPAIPCSAELLGWSFVS